MTIVSDPQGNLFVHGDDGQLTPATIAVNQQTGTKMVLDGGKLHPLPGQEPSQTGSFLRGIVQGATFGLGDELRAGTDALAQGAGNLIHGSEGRPSMGEAYDASLAKNREGFQIDRETNPVATIGGQVAGGVAGTVAGGGALAAGRGLVGAGRLIANPIVGAAVTGATAGRAIGAGEGAAVGGVLGAGAGAAERGISHAISPIRPTVTPEYQRLVGELQNEGVPLSSGEITGSKPLKAAESNLGQLPLAAGPAAEAADQQSVALNRAVLSRAGVTNEDRITSDVLRNQTTNLGRQIGTLAAANDMQMTPQFVQQIGAIRQALPSRSADAERLIGGHLDRLTGMIRNQPGSDNAVVPGQAYQTLLRDVTEDLSHATGDTARQLGNLRNTLRQQMESSMSPADAAQWRQLNRQYANLALIKDAMGGAGAGTAEGNISPLALRGALDRSMGGDAYAMGHGDLNDLARAGQTVLRKPPDSGTGIRTFMNQLMTGMAAHGGGGGVGGAIGGLLLGPPGAAVGGLAGTVFGPRIVQSVMNSAAGRAYLQNQLAPDFQTLARGLAGAGGEYAAPQNRVRN